MWSAVKTLGFGAVVGIAILSRVGTVAAVKGPSMQPALNPYGSSCIDIVFFKRVGRSFGIARGEIVTFILPKNPNRTLVSRVVGLEHDVVVSTMGFETQCVRVPPGHIWVEHDNIESNYDSNNFGPVSMNSVTGKATHIIWPPTRWQALKPTFNQITI